MKEDNVGKLLIWKQENVKPDELPDCFIEFLRREGVIE